MPFPKVLSKRKMRIQNAPSARLTGEEFDGAGEGLGPWLVLDNPRGDPHISDDFIYDEEAMKRARPGDVCLFRTPPPAASRTSSTPSNYRENNGNVVSISGRVGGLVGAGWVFP